MMQTVRLPDQIQTERDFYQLIRRRFLLTFIYGTIGLTWFVLLLGLAIDVQPETVQRLVVGTLVITLFGGGALTVIRSERYLTAVIYGLIVILSSISLIAQNDIVVIAVIALAIIPSSLLLQQTGYYATSLVIALSYLFWAVRNLGDASDRVEAFGALFLTLVVLVLISITTRYFSSTLQRFAYNNRRSNELLQATAQVGEITSKILDLDQLFNEAVGLIRDRFAYYHVQIFLVDDERQYANLVASTGEAGQRLLARNHRLAVGSQSVIGRVTQTGEVVIARDTDRDIVHARNELLPNTRSEMALPILDADRIIGALDVQSTRSDAFRRTDVQALQTMANQIGTAIRNARLFAEQKASVQENKRLFFESEANLREIQRLNRQLTSRSWEDYLASQQSTGGVTISDVEMVDQAEWSPAMIEAAQRRRPVAATRADGQPMLAIPIVLRGEVIGAIEVEDDSSSDEADAIELIQAVAQRLAVSLENARLFEESQETTAQQQHLNSIVGRYQAAGTVDELLQITLAELNTVFGAKAGRIRIGQGTNGHQGTEEDHTS
jgi:GAF domain-containing protein